MSEPTICGEGSITITVTGIPHSSGLARTIAELRMSREMGGPTEVSFSHEALIMLLGWDVVDEAKRIRKKLANV